MSIIISGNVTHESIHLAVPGHVGGRGGFAFD
jgi:hypothetical protein